MGFEIWRSVQPGGEFLGFCWIGLVNKVEARGGQREGQSSDLWYEYMCALLTTHFLLRTSVAPLNSYVPYSLLGGCSLCL